MIRNAAQLGAGLGFYCHAFNEDILQDPVAHSAAEDDLFWGLAELSDYGCELNVKFMAVEQMYSPHQPPWTRQGTRELLTKVGSRSRRPVYVTLDTGHQCGQRRFVRPSEDQVKKSLRQTRLTGQIEPGLWLGPSTAYSLFRSAAASPEEEEVLYLNQLNKEMNSHPYLFADWKDGDTYEWLRDLGCYSPVIHIHQTDGLSSSHSPFTNENNAKGIIRGEDVIKAIAEAYCAEPEVGMPPKCKEIFLTLEIFPGKADLPVDIIRELGESVEYWRDLFRKMG